MLRVGLTGGIACGKSHVVRRLAAGGLHVLDLDAVAHHVMAPGGPAYADVVREFGAGILAPDGSVDRKALGERVFADAAARARLNALVHPRVRAEEARRAPARAGAGEVLVTDAALLVESGVHLRFDRLVVVHCAPELQLRRLMTRDGLDEAAARARIAAQMPVEEKRRFAHLEVDASGTLAETDRATDAVREQLQALAAQAPRPVEVRPERALSALVHGPSDGPRGLTPLRLLRAIAEAGGLEMEPVAALLVPPASGPWYRAARAGEPGPGPESLAAPITLWSLARRGDDTDYTASVAATAARLTHLDAASIAEACLFALALAAAAAAGGLAGLPARWPDLSRLAERWGGAAPRGRVEQAVRIALRHESDPSGARAAGAGAVGEAAGALAGMASGAGAAGAPPEAAAALATVLASSRGPLPGP